MPSHVVGNGMDPLICKAKISEQRQDHPGDAGLAGVHGFEKIDPPPAWSDLELCIAHSPVLSHRTSATKKADAVLALARAEQKPDLTLSLGAKNDQDSGDNEQSDSSEQNAAQPIAPEEEQEEQQPSTKPENNDSGEPEPVNPQDKQLGSGADHEDQKAEDMQRRELGKMTKEEAENLLNALKNEEGELNFVPGGQDAPVGRDW